MRRGRMQSVCSPCSASRSHSRRVIGLEDLGYVPKPSPGAFRSALERVGAPAERCSLIDDLRANLAAAKRLGMRTIWVAEATSDRADETIDHVIADVREIERILVGASGLGVRDLRPLRTHPLLPDEVPVLRLQRRGGGHLARGALRRRADRRAPATRERSAVRRQATGDDLSRRRHALVVRRRIDRPLARPSAPRICRRDDGRDIARSDPRVRRASRRSPATAGRA